MYYSHHFARRDTLSRAHSWLTQLGFHPQRIDNHATWFHRIVMEVEPQRLDALNMLINAVELTDPDGFPVSGMRQGSPTTPRRDPTSGSPSRCPGLDPRPSAGTRSISGFVSSAGDRSPSPSPHHRKSNRAGSGRASRRVAAGPA